MAIGIFSGADQGYLTVRSASVLLHRDG